MHIHGPSHVHGPQSINPPHGRVASSQQPPSGANQADQLDISPQANYISQVNDLPEIRSEKVNQIRAEIEAGTYETPEKLNTALGRLLDEIL